MSNPKKNTVLPGLPFLYSGNRKEVTAVSLQAIEGTIPDDFYGFVYLMTQCGTVNSHGYPYRKKNPDGTYNTEYGSPLLNGNGMVFLFDLSTPEEVSVSSKLMKTPSYYADEASRRNGPSRKQPEFKNFHFENTGISRMSAILGFVNYANTALIPVNFENDSGLGMLATYDTGRPTKIDPQSLDFVTPIGWNREWISSFPEFLQAPFPMFETTAHPTWDPVDKVLYGVNFSKSANTQLTGSIIGKLLQKDKPALMAGLLKIARDLKKHGSADKARKEIEDLIEERKKVQAKSEGWGWKCLKRLLKKLFLGWINKVTTTIDEVLLIKFDGTGDLQKWKVLDEKGDTLVVYQFLHQTGTTQDYIILMDCSFKFAFDLLVSNPFPEEPEIDELIRFVATKQILPSTRLWIVKKSDLIAGNDCVTAYAVKGNPIEGLSNAPYGGIPLECVHFSANYENPNGQITIYTAQNNAACFAEWIRPYDTNYFSGEAYGVSEISNYAVGQTAISGVGKYIIDANTATFLPQGNQLLREAGNLPPVDQLPDGPLQNVGGNTWNIGLYSYRDMISPTVPVNQIKQLFFLSIGARPELLTTFIQRLYGSTEPPYEVPNRIMSLEDVLKYSEKGIPSCLISIDADTMQIAESFEFEWMEFPLSVQFIPKQPASATVAPEKDGYIFVSVKKLIGSGLKQEFQSQIWLFDAANIAQGPVCKLAAPDFGFCTSLHITWMETAESTTSGYMINIEEDFNYMIDNSFLERIEKQKYQDFFDTYVYPNFDNNGANT